MLVTFFVINGPNSLLGHFALEQLWPKEYCDLRDRAQESAVSSVKPLVKQNFGFKAQQVAVQSSQSQSVATPALMRTKTDRNKIQDLATGDPKRRLMGENTQLGASQGCQSLVKKPVQPQDAKLSGETLLCVNGGSACASTCTSSEPARLPPKKSEVIAFKKKSKNLRSQSINEWLTLSVWKLKSSLISC